MTTPSSVEEPARQQHVLFYSHRQSIYIILHEHTTTVAIGVAVVASDVDPVGAAAGSVMVKHAAVPADSVCVSVVLTVAMKEASGTLEILHVASYS